MKKENKNHHDTGINYNNGHHNCKQRQHAHGSSAQDDMKPSHRFSKYVQYGGDQVQGTPRATSSDVTSTLAEHPVGFKV
jgi:hypothetical protein